MERKLEVDLQVIVHATEDMERIFSAFDEVFGVDRDAFSVQNLQGHYENPIFLVLCKLKKKAASAFVRTLVSGMPKGEKDLVLGDLENRCDDSALYLRISKQKLVRGEITLADEDPVKIKIYTPIYTQKELFKTYSEILNGTT
jgi:hypothetical protein